MEEKKENARWVLPKRREPERELGCVARWVLPKSQENAEIARWSYAGEEGIGAKARDGEAKKIALRNG